MSPTMPIELDRSSSEPLYRQVATSIRRAIEDGRLRPGQRVPSVRVLAGQLAVGRLTIATAFEQLAAEGYVVGRIGFGTIAAEDPGDPQVRRSLLASGGRAVGVPVDGQGIRADLLPDRVEVAVVAPTVEVPTGATLPLARRLRLLAWAAASGALLVEDGRSDDLVLRTAPQPCLQGLDNDGRVIHIGSFETLFHEGIRTAYAVVPRALVEPFVAGLEAFDPGASPVQQRALGRFLADGLLDRHVARVRRVLLERQAAALTAIEGELGWLVHARETGGGTRLIATIEDAAWTATDVARVAAGAGIAIETLAPSRVQSAPDRELVIDYGRLEPLELRAAFRLLGRALRAGQRPRPTFATRSSGVAARA